MTMESTDGYEFFIEFYNKQGTLLADIILTQEFLNMDWLEEIEDKLDTVEDVVDNIKDVKEGTPVQNVEVSQKTDTTEKVTLNIEEQAVKGKKLPATATNYGNGLLRGLFLTIIGAFLLRKKFSRAHNPKYYYFKGCVKGHC